MNGIALALAASVGWGVADYIGGRASRSAPAATVLWMTQLTGLVLAAVAALVVGLPRPLALDLLAALGSGIALSVGLGALYRGMAVAPVGVVAPVAAVGAVIPVAFGLATGDHPSLAAAIGIPIAVAGVVLTCVTPAPMDNVRRAALADGVGFGLLAAAGGGATSVALKLASATGVLWVLIVQRATVAAIARAAGARHGAQPESRPVPWRAVAAIGVADVGATGLYTVALRHGPISQISVAASLYPVVTIALAAVLVSERLPARQRLGAAAAMAGVAVIAAGTR